MNAADVTDVAHWQRLMRRLGLSAQLETHQQLCAAYAESHRHYHTLEHLSHCLRTFERVRAHARAGDEVEIALWFHDAIYRPRSSSNEADSARWAQSFLTSAGAAAAQVARVVDLIYATRHTETSPMHDRDTAVLLDVDLAILGEPADDYARFERQVRREYAFVPGFLFRRRRREILASFLARGKIYASGCLGAAHEARAVHNLRAAIAALN